MDLRTVSLSSGLPDITFDPNGDFWVEQAYVQYFVPDDRKSDLPVVFIHGGGLTGSCWETTPDGRPGWINQFLASGIPIHIVDNVERGRAGFCALPGVWPDDPIMRSAQEAWGLFRFGTPSDYFERTPFPGQRFPVDFLDELIHKTVPRWLSTISAQQSALLHLVDRLGPCILLGHSQGGGFSIELGALRPDLVQAVIALEPHGNFESIGRASLQERKLLLLTGDFLDCDDTWNKLAERFKLACGKWSAAGGESEHVRLSDIGMPGHSHLMMMDRGSELISNWLINWITTQTCR